MQHFFHLPPQSRHSHLSNFNNTLLGLAASGLFHFPILHIKIFLKHILSPTKAAKKKLFTDSIMPCLKNKVKSKVISLELKTLHNRFQLPYTKVSWLMRKRFSNLVWTVTHPLCDCDQGTEPLWPSLLFFSGTWTFSRTRVAWLYLSKCMSYFTYFLILNILFLPDCSLTKEHKKSFFWAQVKGEFWSLDSTVTIFPISFCKISGLVLDASNKIAEENKSMVS